VAAIMHNAGSFIVIFNSARLVRQGEELEPYQPATAAETNGVTPEQPAGELRPQLA
jgi:hypothetical protein